LLDISRRCRACGTALLLLKAARAARPSRAAGETTMNPFIHRLFQRLGSGGAPGTWAAIAALLAAPLGAGCSSPDQQPSPENAAHTGARLTIDVLSHTDVGAIQFEVNRVSCNDEPIVAYSNTVTEDLSDILIPGGVPSQTNAPLDSSSQHLYADRFFALTPGCYDVTTTPLKADGTPSADCGAATQHRVQVSDGSTSEITLINQCKGDGTGGLDVISTLNHPPVIAQLTFDDSKFTARCSETIACATVRDPDQDPLEFVWKAAPNISLPFQGPLEMGKRTNPDGTVTDCVSILPLQAGDYEFSLTVYDQVHGANGSLERIEDALAARGTPAPSHAQFSFPLHAADAAGCSCVGEYSNCKELVEHNILYRWSAHHSADIPVPVTTLSILDTNVVAGQRALRAVTNAGYDWWFQYDPPSGETLDVSTLDELHVSLRALNTTPIGWQVNAPIIVLQDVNGHRRTYTPNSILLGRDGKTWQNFQIPLRSGNGVWTISGDNLDFGNISRIEVHTDTWDFGFTLDIDAVSFEKFGAVCPCTQECGAHGQCQAATSSCLCDLGYGGSQCATCADGFELRDGACALKNDGEFTEWPNPASHANSDPWLAVHHDDIQLLKPNLLVLLYPDTGTLSGMTSLVQQVANGFAEGSRPQGYSNASATAQLDYQIHIVDLRDGVNGRPPAPAGFPYQNSTLFPRKPPTPPATGPGTFDYAALFSPAYAPLLGYADPANPGQYFDLCTLINQGQVNELWFVASADVPDAGGLEVATVMPNYTDKGNVIPGSVNRCANGCIGTDVPFCGRSIHMGFVNYTRGPGCFLHSKGHDVEFGLASSIPELKDWFYPFARFDLNGRYGLPFSNLYGLGCSSPPCMQFTSPSSVAFESGTTPYSVNPYDPACGNVHFPPNGVNHYDYSNPQQVLSSCTGFGRHSEPVCRDASSLVSPANWSQYLNYGDCGGEFLVWWYQNMPAFGSGQTFANGKTMKSAWPFWFY
jgi:hypothetical protein